MPAWLHSSFLYKILFASLGLGAGALGQHVTQVTLVTPAGDTEGELSAALPGGEAGALEVLGCMDVLLKPGLLFGIGGKELWGSSGSSRAHWGTHSWGPSGLAHPTSLVSTGVRLLINFLN